MRIANTLGEFLYCANDGVKWGFCYVNPLDIIKELWPDADMSHVEFDPDIEPEYSIIRQGGNDGTLALTLNTLVDVFSGLEDRSSFYKPNPVIAKGYKVGWLSHAIVYGRIELRCGGKYPGQRELFKLPVKCIN